VKIRRHLVLLIVFSFIATIASGAEWQTDYEQALATAKNAKKCVLLNFTGSDWCGPCILMHKRVFAKTAFLEYAEKYLVPVGVDYPVHKALPAKEKEQNEHLKEQYHVEQFPTVILLNPDGKILGQLGGYSGEGPADVIAWVEKLRPK
jgi:thioredoxin-related protein